MYAIRSYYVSRQGYIMASNDIFLLASLLFIGMIGFVWLARPPFQVGGGGEH